MFTILVAVIVAASTLWVYWDATRLRIGRIKDQKGLNLSAEFWALGTLFLWVFFFPAYLIKRGELRQRAEGNPINSRHKPLWYTLFGLMGAAFIWNAYVNQPESQVPNCSAFATKSLIKDILTNNLQQNRVQGEPTIHVNAPRTLESGFGTYRCKAMVDIQLPDGRTVSGRTIRYISTASDNGRHVVEIRAGP